MSMDSAIDFINFVQDGVMSGDPTVIGGIITLVIVLIVTLVVFIRISSGKRSGILLLGLCEAGKTLLFSRLVNNKYVPTHTSIRENYGTYVAKGKKSGTFQLYDLPGHERLRYQCLDHFKAQARGIIFVVDSSTFQKDVKDVAEYLYILLTDAVIAKNHPSILIACNKSDQAMAKGCRVIQLSLEKEINMLRVTRSAALQATHKTASKHSFLGKKGKDFTFQDLRSFKVEFVESSGRSGSDESQCDLSHINTWLTSLL